VPIGNRNQYVPAPATAEQIAAVHHALWMALVMIPKHKHRTAVAEDDCSTCTARRYLNEAYKALPSGESA
jgi:hypothetical protein